MTHFLSFSVPSDQNMRESIKIVRKIGITKKKVRVHIFYR